MPIQEGWFQKHIADFAYETALCKQSGEKPVIGVNKYVEADEHFDIETRPPWRASWRGCRRCAGPATTRRCRRCSSSW